MDIYVGVIVPDPLPTLQRSASSRWGNRPFLPANFDHPFPQVYGCRSLRWHKFQHILAFAILEAESVAASCVLASRGAGRLI